MQVPLVPSRNWQSSWKSKNEARNRMGEYLMVSRDGADIRAEEETNE